MSGTAGVEKVAQVLEKTLGDLGLLAIARKYEVLHLWDSIVGEDISKHARPRRLQGDTLFVATSSSVWAQELTFMKAALVGKINQALGGSYIADIRFSEHLWGAQKEAAKSGSPKSPAVGALRVRPAGASARGLDLGREIGDPALKRAFNRAVLAMERREEQLISKGYSACGVCGAFYPSGPSGYGACPACEHRKELAGYNRSIAILERRPEFRDEEVSRLLSGVPQAIVARARRDLDSRLESQAQARVPRTSRGKDKAERHLLRAELGETVMKLAALRLGIRVQQLTAADVERAVGRKLAALVKKE